MGKLRLKEVISGILVAWNHQAGCFAFSLAAVQLGLWWVSWAGGGGGLQSKAPRGWYQDWTRQHWGKLQKVPGLSGAKWETGSEGMSEC